MGLENRVCLQALIGLRLDVAFERVLVVHEKHTLQVKHRHSDLPHAHVNDEAGHQVAI